VDRWSKAINDDNFFGVDVVSSATKTAQNSVDGISGATVRISRESTSYQRALVKAGILEEKEVIKGRF
jgi:Na+-transporting NADH:ubiquinone oxidoreductase subunit NqrC